MIYLDLVKKGFNRMNYIEQILVVMVLFAIIIENYFIYHYLKKFWEILRE